MSLSAIGSGLSGMQSFQRAIDVSANNVANLNTNGFQPQQTNFESAGAGGVNTVVSPPKTPQSASASLAPSGTDYATEAVNSLQDKFGFDASAQVVKTADQTLGTLINITA